MFKPGLVLSDDVRAARRAGRPMVALESTLISHGLPWPANLETAREAEAAVRAAGAVPATVAVIDGEPRVGLRPDDVERLARGGIAKASRRDLPALVASRGTAGTTVAATMFLAIRAGIRIMATGGIGGVHHAAAETWDVSADLLELARTLVAVVCSGAKSILDLPRTLEFLETHGVPVIGYGTDEFPAFYAAASGLRLDSSVDSPHEAARVIHAAESLNSGAGVLFAQPPPSEGALSRAELDRLVDQAVAAADAAGVRGKGLTPFLLARLRELGGDRVVALNQALVVANARLAAQIACALKQT